MSKKGRKYIFSEISKELAKKYGDTMVGTHETISKELDIPCCPLTLSKVIQRMIQEGMAVKLNRSKYVTTYHLNVDKILNASDEDNYVKPTTVKVVDTIKSMATAMVRMLKEGVTHSQLETFLLIASNPMPPKIQSQHKENLKELLFRGVVQITSDNSIAINYQILKSKYGVY